MDYYKIDDTQLAYVRQEINHFVLVANNNETKALMQYLRPIKNIFNNYFNDKILLYESESVQRYYIGIIEETLVVATILSEMGGIKTNAATLVTAEAIRLFEPRFATIVGICASMNAKVKIGDVVIANPIISYDSKKETENRKIYRGQRFYPYKLINRFDYAQLSSFNSFHVHKGEVASGETLANSKSFREELTKDFPETLALDMEGIGFATACVKMNVDWLFVKGVSDDGFNKTDAYQKTAAANAFEVVQLLYKTNLNPKLLKPSPSRSSSIFISGALYWDEKNNQEAENCLFARVLSKKILGNGFRIVTALGNTIGDEILAATYEHLFSETNGTDALLQNSISNQYLMTIPFPYEILCKGTINDTSSRYVGLQRRTLIGECSIAIFIFGNKKEEVQSDVPYKESNGMIEEFKIAQKMGCLVVPVGATGYAAHSLYKNCDNSFADTFGPFVSKNEMAGLKYRFEQLNPNNFDPMSLESCEELANAVIDFIKFVLSH